jgi:hypothetical protein
MPLSPSDIQFRLSGGASNTDPNASRGGAKSSQVIADGLNFLFDNITGDQAATAAPGYVDFRCIYIHNVGGGSSLPLLSAVIWISQDTSSSQDEVDIGLGTSIIGGTEQGPLSTEETVPTGVTFSHPTTKGTGLTIGDIPSSSHKAVWIKRRVDSGAAAFNNNSFIIRVEGDTQA